MIPVKLLNAVGLTRTENTFDDMKKYHDLLNDPQNLLKVQAALKQIDYPFYRYFSNYGTGIGETIEEVVGRKFANNVVPKTITPTKILKNGCVKQLNPKKNPAYAQYNKITGKKPSNYDWLATIKGQTKAIEVKVIRAAESKGSIKSDKLNEIPSLLEERALIYANKDYSGNGSFQQTKPEFFDYLIGIVIYADQVDFYIVPSVDITSGKLKITKQHAGAINDDGSTDEGHLAVSTLVNYKAFSVYSEEQLLAVDNLAKYIV